MEVAVFDTYVTTTNGKLMHFDVIVPTDAPEEKVLSFGREYLKQKNKQVKSFSAKECQFCHVQGATKEMQAAIQSQGYFIYEMEGCR